MGGEIMTTFEMANLVRRWFEQAEQADGPLLPDGWFGGRRGEAGGSLEDVQASTDGLVIRLSEDTTLLFDRPGRVFVEDSELVVDGYKQATLRWKHYGGGPDALYHEKSYDSGQVRLAPPVGTTVSI
jgi:hypothetical protein